MTTMSRAFTWILVLCLPGVAAAATYSTFADLAAFLVSMLNAGTALLVVAGLVIYFYGITHSMFKAGEKDHSQLKTQLLWGVAILFVMVSIWGIVNLLQETIFGGNASGGGAGGGTSQPGGNPFDPPAFIQE